MLESPERDPQDPIAGTLKIRIANAIALERAAAAVEAVAVELDDQSLPLPESVHLEAGHYHVERGRGQVLFETEIDEAPLQRRPGVRRVSILRKQGTQSLHAAPSAASFEQALQRSHVK